MSVAWSGLTGDFETGLDFLLDLMTGGNYSDRETILQVIDKYIPDYDMSKGENGPSLAYSLAERCIRQDSRFRYLLNPPEIHGFLKEIQNRLTLEQEHPEDTDARKSRGRSNKAADRTDAKAGQPQKAGLSGIGRQRSPGGYSGIRIPYIRVSERQN